MPFDRFQNRKAFMECYLKCEKPVLMRTDMHIAGANFEGIHTYKNGHCVPIYLANDFYALNKILGYANYINGDYGTILYRGEGSLHNTLLPSMYRGINTMRAFSKVNFRLNELHRRVLNDANFTKTVLAHNQPFSELILEGMLQHYGVKTHFIDVVDNHWIALWFGLYKATKIKSVSPYVYYTKRIDNIKAMKIDNMYQYLILIASNNNITNLHRLCSKCETVTIDLRANLPSTFLRPHAQHGFVIRKLRYDETDGYDMSRYVVGIIKLTVDNVDKWLGNGSLLTVNNLFPSPAFDLGYDLLLNREDLFADNICKIAY